MLRSALFIISLIWGAGVAHADTGQQQITAIIRHQAAAIAAVDAAAIQTDWVNGGSIIDVFAPYFWTGPGFQADWIKGFSTGIKNSGSKNLKVNVGKALQISITGDDAYAACPIWVSWTANGKQWRETGTWSVVLRHTDAGWRIAAWAWGGGAPIDH